MIAKVNGTPWDLTRVFEEDSSLELVKFDDHEGKDTFWHSSAHILGQALELHTGGELCYGPEIESGFYYDTSVSLKFRLKIPRASDNVYPAVISEMRHTPSPESHGAA